MQDLKSSILRKPSFIFSLFEGFLDEGRKFLSLRWMCSNKVFFFLNNLYFGFIPNLPFLLKKLYDFAEHGLEIENLPAISYDDEGIYENL